jgi:tRNA pseudouridine32 synthase/23S rRNA pseudouridine746 synthase
MASLVTWLERAPALASALDQLPSPFDDEGPHPIARRAALALQEELLKGELAPGVSTRVLDRPEGGKMLGVMVARAADGRLGVVKAFSGQVDGRWEVPGWAPPAFDAEARLRVEPAADVAVKALTARMEELAASAELQRAREAFANVEAELARERAELRTHHAQRRRRRHEARAHIAPADVGWLRLLGDESRRDDGERRALDGRCRALAAAAVKPLRRLLRRLEAMGRLRRLISRRAMQAIHDTYQLTNAAGRRTTLRALFASGEPPWGAGDCAAPKLLVFAVQQGLRPLALAEFWWGPPPPGGGRVQGRFYPACRTKCGPILPFLLEGFCAAARRVHRPASVSGGPLRILHEDERLLVVLKPVGLLSVPGKDPSLGDSVLSRLRERLPDARGPLLVHRLDLDTSGLLLAAKDDEAHRFLQAQFISRSVRKRYVAWLEGEVFGEAGSISLPLRVDLDQRPVQIVDFQGGREALTDWSVVLRKPGRTRIWLSPRSGRTHQLRVHAAHRLGLGAPIIGDRLYGRGGERLLLHAESLTIRHPDGRQLTFAAPAPF